MTEDEKREFLRELLEFRDHIRKSRNQSKKKILKDNFSQFLEEMEYPIKGLLPIGYIVQQAHVRKVMVSHV